MSNDIKISIILPVHNGEKFIEKCIKSLQNQTYPKHLYEIIVIDNNSTDNGINLARIFDVKIIHESKKGSYAARNKGINAAKGKYLGFIDADCIASETWIEKAMNYFINNKDVSIISGNVEFFSEGKETVWGIYDKNRFLKQEHISKFGSAITANLFVRREVFEKVGLFNGDLVSGGDGEWTRRAVNAGYKLTFLKDLLVLHPTRNSFKDIAKKCYRIGFGKGQLFKEQRNILKLLYPTHLMSSIRIIPKSVINSNDSKMQKILILIQLIFVEIILCSVNQYGKFKGYFNR